MTSHANEPVDAAADPSDGPPVPPKSPAAEAAVPPRSATATPSEDAASPAFAELNDKLMKALQQKSELESRNEQLEALMAKETRQKENAQHEAAQLQNEISELSEELFARANVMVADARRAQKENGDLLEKENAQLKAQVDESSALLQSMEAQINGLKTVIMDLQNEQEKERQKHMRSKRASAMFLSLPSEDIAAAVVTASEPQSPADTPVLSSGAQSPSAFPATQPSTPAPLPQLRPAASILGEDAVAGPLREYTLESFERPTLRMDLPVFNDFMSLAGFPDSFLRFYKQRKEAIAREEKTKKNDAAPASGIARTSTASPVPASPSPLSSSAPSAGTLAPPAPLSPEASTSGPLAMPAVPGRFPSNYGQPQSSSQLSPVPWRYNNTAIRDVRPFKRFFADDVEVTLKLSESPFLSYFARRSLLNAIYEGTAIVEPIAGVNESYKYFVPTKKAAGAQRPEYQLLSSGQHDKPVATFSPCALCGESRNDSYVYARLHNLRVDKPESSRDGSKADASKESQIANPLCFFCVNRVRTVCDFISFMKSVKDGIRKLDISDWSTIERAWGECNRLRERMFWARNGGYYFGTFGTEAQDITDDDDGGWDHEDEHEQDEDEHEQDEDEHEQDEDEHEQDDDEESFVDSYAELPQS